MATPDDEIHWLLYPDGWKREGDGEPLAAITYYMPEKMYQRGYWGKARELGERLAIDAAYKSHGRKPRSSI